MIRLDDFPYQPLEHETEKASNSYLMSLIAIIVGMPLPIVNLLATFFFYLALRKSTYFVRWHCTQALLAQVFLFVINTIAFWWTVMIFLGHLSLSNGYFAWLAVAIVANLIDLIATIYSAIQTRKGKHVSWFFYGHLTDQICKPTT